MYIYFSIYKQLLCCNSYVLTARALSNGKHFYQKKKMVLNSMAIQNKKLRKSSYKKQNRNNKKD